MMEGSGAGLDPYLCLTDPGGPKLTDPEHWKELNIFEDPKQILLFFRGPQMVFSNFQKHIGTRRVDT
jgi:hypothetical protein